MTLCQRWWKGSLLSSDKADATLAVLGDTRRFLPPLGVLFLLRLFGGSFRYNEVTDMGNGDGGYMSPPFDQLFGDEGSITMLLITTELLSIFSFWQSARSEHTLSPPCCLLLFELLLQLLAGTILESIVGRPMPCIGSKVVGLSKMAFKTTACLCFVIWSGGLFWCSVSSKQRLPFDDNEGDVSYDLSE